MIDKVAAYVAKEDLIRPNQAVLIALSGGPDSVVLLHVLNSLKSRWSLRLGAVHLNHSIRKRAAVEEQRFCRELCEKYKIEFYEETLDVPALAEGWKISLEEASRRCRYELFERVAHEARFELVATGHHKNDQAETVLFRLIRGSARRGLSGIAPKRGIFIRPLLGLSREEIVAYAGTHRLQYMTDESNRDERFARNFVRHRLIPLIEEKLNPAVVNQLALTAELFSAEEEFLNGLVEQEINRRLVVRPSGKYEIDLKNWPKIELWLRRRVVRQIMTQLSGESFPPDKESVDRLLQAIEGGRSEITLPGRIRAAQNSGKLYLAPSKKVSFNRELPTGSEIEIERLKLRFRIGKPERLRSEPSRKRRASKVALAAEAIMLPLRVRSIQPGDRFRPLGLNGSKKVGDYLTDLKIPVILRDEIPVVCDAGGIIWLAGYEIADRVKICNTTKEAMTIEYENFSGDQEPFSTI